MSILRLTTHLKHLSIGNLVKLGGEDEGVEEAMANLTYLRSLYLWTDNAGEIDSYEGAALASLIDRWKDFSALKLKGMAFKTHAWTATTICKAQLTSVDLFGALFTDEELGWLLSSSADSLTTLRHIEIPVRPLSSLLAGFAGLFGRPRPPPSSSSSRLLHFPPVHPCHQNPARARTLPRHRITHPRSSRHHP